MVSVVVVSVLFLFANAEAEQAVETHSAHSGDLASALEFISTTFHVPVIAELTKSYPDHILLSAGRDGVSRLLDAICVQAPGYSWENMDGVVLFFNKRLRTSSGNFFNAKIDSFVMPSNLGDLVLQLNQVMGAGPGTAPLMVGVPGGALARVPLHQGETLTNVTGREVLIDAAKQTMNIFSVILFPTVNPKTQKEFDEARINWFTRTVSELPRNPTHLRSIPSKPGA
jgi:hypothetical protein